MKKYENYIKYLHVSSINVVSVMMNVEIQFYTIICVKLFFHFFIYLLKQIKLMYKFTDGVFSRSGDNVKKLLFNYYAR